MMQTDAHGAQSGDPSSGGVSPSEAVVDHSFFGKERMIPAAWGGWSTPISTYYGGNETFEVRIGLSTGHHTSVWTDCRGVDAMIDSLLALKANAAHAWDMAKLPKPPIPAEDIPF